MALSTNNMAVSAEKLKVIPWESLIGIISIILYIVDVGSDIVLAVSYYINGHVIYFSLTLTFVVLPILFTNMGAYLKSERDPLVESKVVKYCRCVLSFCCLGLLWLLIEVQWYEWQRRRIKNNRKKNDKEMADYYKFVRFFTLLEALIESAPQLLLQLYIMISSIQIIRSEFNTGFHPGIPQVTLNLTSAELSQQYFKAQINTQVIIQIISICASLASISWSITNFIRTSQISRDENTMTWKGCVCYFLWRLFQVSTRVLALALFTSAFTAWCSVTLVFRFSLILSACCYFGRGKGSECFPMIVTVCLFAFTFYYIEDNGISIYYVIYFVYRVIEDTCLIGLWCWVVDPVYTWFYWWCVGFYFVGISLDFMFMMLYLRRFNPNSSSRSYTLKQLPVTENELPLEINSGV